MHDDTVKDFKKLYKEFSTGKGAKAAKKMQAMNGGDEMQFFTTGNIANDKLMDTLAEMMVTGKKTKYSTMRQTLIGIYWIGLKAGIKIAELDALGSRTALRSAGTRSRAKRSRTPE